MSPFSDPFSTTAQLAQQGLGSIGQGLQAGAEAIAKRKEEERLVQVKMIGDLISSGYLQPTTKEEGTMNVGGFPFKLGANVEQELKMKKLQAETTKAEAEAQQIQEFTGLGEGGGFRPKSVDVGAVSYERVPTEEEKQGEIEFEAKKAAGITTEKEKQVNIGKVKRLSVIADTVEKKWLETQPGKGGKGRIAGLMSIPASFAQSTEQQQIDTVYRDFIQGARAQLARAMGDVGNLSEYEQKAVKNLVPSLGDNYETGMQI